MQEPKILDHLAQLNLSNRFALQLREELMSLIKNSIPVPVRKGSIDLTWLAERIGATRQIFYPGRGSSEVIQLLSLLNQHLNSGNHQATKPSEHNIECSKLRVELTLVRQENLNLKQQLRLVRHEQDMMHASGIMLGDLD
ncbi:hypothetical protein PSYMO_11675 [Pseudomonas amygdali pv. mori str. 301020]|uniref:Uncharacterized protein n=2 Tax=Pseudomonas syringae group TaxID=136849 RepID=A0A656G920_PSEA0|nr:hypothetical protein PSYMO_11675 [Pseudomonas amygdali pv. mori str. 301020]PYD17906.1 hypothetical protein DND62_00490 [Pseudomonas syringae pv. pisi]